mmetsp:Transcript_58071/g.92274  ORF Transcript_58071/g.92274 Transcript_58071/m.92274 type:complete len:735 (+) Transcript_58071:47-2251(+)
MAWRSKNAYIFIVDIGHSMSQSFDGGKLTRVKKALSLALSCVQQKLFFTPKHEVGIVFFGAQETKNELATDGYDHVVVGRDGVVDVPDVSSLKCLFEPPMRGSASDAINALIVAQDLLNKRCGQGRYVKQIHLLTDSGSIVAGDPDLVEVTKQLERTATQLSVTLFEEKVGPWTSVIAGSSQVDLIPVAELERRCSVCSKPVEQRAKVRLSLEISPDIHIPVGIYGKTLSVRIPGLKKRSRLAAAVPTEMQKTDRVIYETTYHVADDEAGEEVKKEDRIKGHKYGSSIVPMSEYDEAALMYTCERTLKALGFAPASCVSPEHSTYQIEVVAADRADRWAYAAVESLISAMIAEERVLIARYCFRKNAWPKVVALIPQAGASSAGHFVMQYLPFADDMREWSFASLPAPTIEQRKVVASLIDTMNLDGLRVNGDSSSELLCPESTNSPSLVRFYDFLARRAVDPAAKVPQFTAGDPCSLERPAQIIEKLNLANYAEKMRKEFALEKIEKTAKKGKRFWHEAIAEKRKEAEFGEVDTKRIKVDIFAKKDEKEEDDKTKSEMGVFQVGGAVGSEMAMPVPAVPAVQPKVHIGSIHPERDFERWLAHRVGGHDTVGPAIEQMKTMVENFAEEGEEFHSKALSCLSCLRNGCVREGEVIAFNNFIRVLRLGKTSRKANFWLKARDVGLGLITDREAPTSTVTAEESRAFLAGESSHAVPLVPEVTAAPLSEQALEAMLE